MLGTLTIAPLAVFVNDLYVLQYPYHPLEGDAMSLKDHGPRGGKKTSMAELRKARRERRRRAIKDLEPAQRRIEKSKRRVRRGAGRI